ncbi:hypothetical protein CONLIGDRAFT_668657 [Coniochaeta ligniaria NRRL 30616]|uniref:Uncharacterized protein n=1 Tax=Coniochaeta ligniaria NRRL 30616 TaxID=1408157 RepID=A0A1J7JLI5_9PEZI|nr:hypothetical protein CONLIGDRAFT_668657 [Coniochaeta ligniaria NRRL 30616]
MMDSSSGAQEPESRGPLASVKHLESTAHQQQTTINTLQLKIKQQEAQLDHHEDQLKQLSNVIKQQNAKFALLEAELPVPQQTQMLLPEPRILEERSDYFPWIYYMDMKLRSRNFTEEEEFWYFLAHLGRDVQRTVATVDVLSDKDLNELRDELRMWYAA